MSSSTSGAGPGSGAGTEAEQHASRECPVCGRERLCSAGEFSRIFDRRLLDDVGDDAGADRVCSWCHSVRVAGAWFRLKSVDSRAFELSAAGSRAPAHYRRELDAGPLEAPVLGDGGEEA